MNTTRNCMKCGREIALGQVFCKECLADMSEYPIKPGTPVPIYPQVEAPQPKRTTAKKAKKTEEQVLILKKWMRRLIVAFIAVTLIFSVVTAILVHQLSITRESGSSDQNYSTVDSTK